MEKPMTIKEYYECLKIELEKLNDAIKIKQNEDAHILRCCDVIETEDKKIVKASINKMHKLVSNKIGFIEILKATFGYKIFNEISDEELEKIKKAGCFTPERFDDILTMAYGSYDGYKLNRPNSWNELYMFILKCFEAIEDDRVTEKNKSVYYNVLYRLATFMTNIVVKNINAVNNMTEARNAYNTFIKGYDAKNYIKKEDISQDQINILNQNSNKFILQTKDNEKIEIGLGSTLLFFIDDFNEIITQAKKEVDDSKINYKAEKYYKKIVSIPFNELDKKNFPKYSNKNFKEIMQKILNSVEDAMIVDEDLTPYYTVLMMHYAHYFRTNNYIQDSNVKTI